MRKIFIPFIILLGVIFLLTAYYLSSNRIQKQSLITSFEACSKAGYPILESYPPVCKTPSGKTFTQNVGNELKYHDEIIIESPRPNQTVTKSFKISGRARDSWFFEGQLYAELVDEHNTTLGKVILRANGEWMTQEFVPFSGEMQLRNDTVRKAILKIRNDNPSGLAENQKELVIPVGIQ